MIIITILASIITRVIGLVDIALWHDEAFSVLLSRLPLGELIYRTGLDVHPPAYYILLKGWTSIWGQSLWSFRGMSAFFGVLLVVTSYYFVRQVFPKIPKKYLWFLPAWLAFAPFQVQYSQEMRMYSLGAWLAIIVAYLLVLIFRTRVTKTKIALGVLLGLVSSAILYDHYYLPFSLAGLGIFWLVYLWKQKLPKSTANILVPLVAWITAIVSLIPWLKTLLAQIRQVQESYWIPPMGRFSVPNTLLKMILGSEVSIEQSYFYAIPIVLVVVLIVYGLIKTKSFYKWLVLSMFLVPFLGSIAFSLKTAIYLDRYFIFVQAFFYILIFLGIVAIKHSKIRYGLLILFLLTNIYGLYDYKKSLGLENRPGMKAASEYVNENFEPGDDLFFGSSFLFFNFQYYNKTNTKPLLYAPGEVSHFSGSALLFDGDTLKEFPEKPTNGQTIWLLNTTGFGNWQPEVPDTWEFIDEAGFDDAQNRGWILVKRYR